MDAGLFGHVKKRIESNPSVSFQRKIDWHSESDLPTQEVDLKKCIFSLYSDHDTLKEPKPRARREVPSHYVVGPLPGDTQLSLCVPLSLSLSNGQISWEQHNDLGVSQEQLNDGRAISIRRKTSSFILHPSSFTSHFSGSEHALLTQ